MNSLKQNIQKLSKIRLAFFASATALALGVGMTTALDTYRASEFNRKSSVRVGSLCYIKEKKGECNTSRSYMALCDAAKEPNIYSACDPGNIFQIKIGRKSLEEGKKYTQSTYGCASISFYFKCNNGQWDYLLGPQNGAVNDCGTMVDFTFSESCDNNGM